MISALITGALAKAVESLTGNLVAEVGKAWAAYQNKQISEAERDARIAEAQANASVAITTKSLDAMTEMWDSFQQTVRASPIVARAYVAIMVSQTFCLLWFQWGMEAFNQMFGVDWAMPDNAAQLAFYLIAICLGGGPLVMKEGVAIWKR